MHLPATCHMTDKVHLEGFEDGGLRLVVITTCFSSFKFLIFQMVFRVL